MQPHLGPLDFVVRIVLVDSQSEQAFPAGTGIVVAPDRVLTCRHVTEVPGLPPGHENQNRMPADLWIRIDDEPPVAVSDIKRHRDHDLALLTLDRALDITPAAFLYDLRPDLIPQLATRELLAYGYPAARRGEVQEIKQVVAPITPQSDGSTVVKLQLNGGVEQGCSGGPLVLFDDNVAWCLGVNYLGGEGAMSLSTVTADVILEFLLASGIRPRHRQYAHRILSPQPERRSPLIDVCRHYMEDLPKFIARPKQAFEHTFERFRKFHRDPHDTAVPVKACLCLFRQTADRPAEFAHAVAQWLASDNPGEWNTELLDIVRRNHIGIASMLGDVGDRQINDYDEFRRFCHDNIHKNLKTGSRPDRAEHDKRDELEQILASIKQQRITPDGQRKPLVLAKTLSLQDLALPSVTWLRWWPKQAAKAQLKQLNRLFEHIERWNDEWLRIDRTRFSAPLYLLFCLKIPRDVRPPAALQHCFGLEQITESNVDDWFDLFCELIREHHAVRREGEFTRVMNELRYSLHKSIDGYPIAYDQFYQSCQKLTKSETPDDQPNRPAV
jgi:hypothetical protein